MRVGLSVNPNKTSIVLFTKKRNRNGVRPLRFFDSEIVVTEQRKYVGVILDSKLSWTTHVEFRTKNSGLRAIPANLLYNLGSNPSISNGFTTVVGPILAYGYLVWWQKGEVRTVQSKLGHLQRMCFNDERQ